MDWLSRITRVFRTHQGSSYRRATQELDDDESLLNHEKAPDSECEDGTNIPTLDKERPSIPPWLKYTGFGLLLALYSFVLVTFAPCKCSDVECGKQVSLWSPMNEALEYIEYDFNNEFDQATEYRGPPSPQLEKAWDQLWRFGPVPFPEDKLPLVNRSEGVLNGDKLARLSDGHGAVAANFEIYHQLHCLNYLRQYSWRDWYFRHPDKVVIPADMLASDVGVRMHADHCIDLLRTSIMCHGDTTPFFTVVDPSQPMGARGDFSAHHKCKNFTRLQEWTRENSQEFQAFEEE